MIPYLGEAAAVGASLSWAFAALFFTRAGGGVGSAVVNAVRLPLAAAVLLLVHWLVTGSPWPALLTWDQAGWLLASGLAAHVIGDGLLYTSFVLVGPRVSQLVGTCNPLIATALAWALLGESLGIAVAVGAAVTLAGVLSVVAERPNGAFAVAGRDRRLGLALASINAVLQAIGIVTARVVLVGGVSPLSAITVRLVLAAGAATAWLIWRGHVGSGFRALMRQRDAAIALAGGTVLGPIVGASLSMVAMQAVQVGVASTLLALQPIFLLPLSALAFGERITWRAATGTTMAILGVAILVLR